MTEMYIKDTCEAAIITTFHPATAIRISVQELEDSGGVSLLFFHYTNLKIFEVENNKFII